MDTYGFWIGQYPVAHIPQGSFNFSFSFFISIGIACLMSAAVLAAELDTDTEKNITNFCRATQEYLAKTADTHEDYLVDLDFSCLTNLPLISSDLSSYQLIDTRLVRELDISLSDAWKIPVTQLKTKAFLKERRLLLIGEGFNRVQAASDCAVLRSAGFDNVKILVGGVDTWRIAKRNRRLPVNTSIKTVSAQQVLHEYHNNKVVLIATTQEIAENLSKLGLDYHLLESDYTAEKITDIVVTNTGDGFYPAVVVGDEKFANLTFKNPLPNLYELVGGVESLSQQVKNNMLTNHRRSSVPKRFVCGKS